VLKQYLTGCIFANEKAVIFSLQKLKRELELLVVVFRKLELELQ